MMLSLLKRLLNGQRKKGIVYVGPSEGSKELFAEEAIAACTTKDGHIFFNPSNICGRGLDTSVRLAQAIESDMPSKEWIAHAYPLQQITVQVQGTRHSDRNAMIDQLEEVIERLKRGDMKGVSHDDDFGYRFNLEPTTYAPSFFDEPAANF
jgi:hypothetical protein